jgi:hypothetical protein
MNLTIRLFLLVGLAILPALAIETYNEYAARPRFATRRSGSANGRPARCARSSRASSASR